MAPDPDKTEVISAWPPPTSTDQLKSFLGLCSYYRRFVPNFAQIAAPLHAAVTAGNEPEWSHECQQAFEILKTCLKWESPPLLTAPDMTKEFQLCTNASDYGIGAILEQKGRVIAYASRTFEILKTCLK
uniref:RNA-directed DNA polymerase n=1 Tax=Trichuris muris TaxID=70415 RepID=A0A5S6QT55_TRIMR